MKDMESPFNRGYQDTIRMGPRETKNHNAYSGVEDGEVSRIAETVKEMDRLQRRSSLQNDLRENDLIVIKPNKFL